MIIRSGRLKTWIGIGIAAALKPYPEDFDAAGKILVDGAKMAKDTYKGVGWCIGFLAGWVLEKRKMETMYYIAADFDGDYVHLKRIDEESDELKLVARALLPPEIMEGSKLKYEMMTYSMV